MKKFSLRAKYTVFISVFFAVAIAISAFLSAQESSKTAIKIFIEDGTPLVRMGAAFLEREIALFNKVAAEKTQSAEYEKLRLNLLSLKRTSSAKYFYSMIRANANEYMYVIDGSCDPSDEENFSPLGTLETADNYGKPAKLALETGTLQSSKIVAQEGWGHLITIFCPIMQGQHAVGFIAADYDATDLRASIKKMILQNVIVALALIVVANILVSFVLKGLFDRIKNVSDSISDIASGKANLLKKIEVGKNDEIGDLVQNCNALTKTLLNMVSSIKQAVWQLSKTGEDVSKQMQKTTKSAEKAGNATREIDECAKKQSETMTLLSKNSGKVGEIIYALDKKIAEQTQAISQISSSAEQISANIKSVDLNIEKVSSQYEKLVQVSKSGQQNQAEVVDRVGKIQDLAEQLNDANVVISKIAGQTNLLAMNAAIEAAHAGTVGQGFAVVASEIRNLAENSAKQSKSIALVIKTITDAIFGIADISKRSLSSFEDVDSKIAEIQSMIFEVKQSVDEEDAGAKTLVDSMMVINSSSHSINDASRSMKKQSDEVFSEIDFLKNAANEITNLSSHAQNSMEEILNQAKTSSIAATKNQEMSARVKEIVEKFEG